MRFTQTIYKHITFLTMVALVISIILPFGQAYASEDDKVDLQISPSDHWLEVSNMKPGGQSENDNVEITLITCTVDGQERIAVQGNLVDVDSQ